MSSFENRKYLRADIALKVEYKTLTAPVIEGMAYTKDISILGINLIIPYNLSKDARLKLKICFDEEAAPVFAQGKILWQKRCDYLPESKKQYYISGIQFEDMEVEDAVRTSEFVRGYLMHQSETEIKNIIERSERLNTPSP